MFMSPCISRIIFQLSRMCTSPVSLSSWMPRTKLVVFVIFSFCRLRCCLRLPFVFMLRLRLPSMTSFSPLSIVFIVDLRSSWVLLGRFDHLQLPVQLLLFLHGFLLCFGRHWRVPFLLGVLGVPQVVSV